MSSSNSRLSLEDLAARLDVLEQENHILHARLAAFERPIADGTDAFAPAAMERLSRRWLLRRGLQVAAATAAAGVLVQRDNDSTSANHNDDLVSGFAVLTHIVQSDSEDNRAAVYATANNTFAGAVHAKNLGTGPGVYAESASANGAIEGKSLNAIGSGVWGSGKTGVIGVSSHPEGTGVLGDGAVGVKGSSSKSNYAAVAGDHTGTVGYGVSGVGKGAAAGVLGRNPAGDGVRGVGNVGVKGEGPAYVGVHGDGRTGVWGTTSTRDYSGVYGQSNDFGYGVYGTSPSRAGVHGACAGGFGVQGEGRTGVHGKATGVAGYGGQFEGGKAQLRIVPLSTAGKPTSGTHAKGELVLDSAAVLWICIVGGTPGTWRKFTTASA